MSKANGSNGTEEITFKKNVDYFEMAEGTFYTVEALQKKYGLGRSTIYNKARDAGMEIEKIAGFPCFMDDNKIFSKKERNRIANLEGHKLISYAELVRRIEELLKTIRAATIPEGHTDNKLATIETLLLNSLEHQKANNKLLTEILNHLTNGGK